MMFTHQARRSLGGTPAALLALVLLSGCNLFGGNDDDDEPEVATMRLTFTASGTADQVLNVTGAAGENRSVTLGLGSTSVAVLWLRADGQPDPIAHTNEFRLKAAVQGQGVTWTQSAATTHAGTLNIPAAVTNVGVTFELEHIAEAHPDFGPFEVRVTAQ